jgi:triosephosphate isomerase
MRARYLFATLKNRLTPQETVDLTLAVRDRVRPDSGDIVGLCPSAAALAWARDCKGGLALAAQNCGWTASYSLTGELSVRDLETLAVSHCIVGHSERRIHLGESEDIIRLRLSALLSAAIVPILCVGETLAQRQGQATVEVLRVQLATLLEAFTTALIKPHPSKLIIAYEPIWAISTSGPHLPIEPDHAAVAHSAVRELLDELFGAHFGEATSVIFGGGVDGANAEGFLERPEIDGGLVGSGMQTASGFKGVLDGFYRVRR